MPRPIPVSNRLAERDRLKVAMHWYWFHVFEHPGRVRIGALDLEAREQLVPARMQACERVVDRPRLRRSGRATLLVPSRAARTSARPSARRRRGRNANVSDSPGPSSQLELVRRRSGSSRARRSRSLAPANGTAASCSPLWTPTNASREVSKPAIVARAAEERHMRRAARGTPSCGRSPRRRARPRPRRSSTCAGSSSCRSAPRRSRTRRRRRGDSSFVVAAGVADGRPPDLDVLAGRDEEAELDLDAVLRAEDARVAQPVPALVAVERRLRRLPTRIPDRVAVADVEVAADRVVAARRCSGSASAAAAARRARTCSRRPCSCRGRRDRPGRGS